MSTRRCRWCQSELTAFDAIASDLRSLQVNAESVGQDVSLVDTGDPEADVHTFVAVGLDQIAAELEGTCLGCWTAGDSVSEVALRRLRSWRCAGVAN